MPRAKTKAKTKAKAKKPTKKAKRKSPTAGGAVLPVKQPQRGHEPKLVITSADPPKEGPCTNCKEPTSDEYFCFGCKHFICHDCDLPNDDEGAPYIYPDGPHTLDDHILDEDRAK